MATFAGRPLPALGFWTKAKDLAEPCIHGKATETRCIVDGKNSLPRCRSAIEGPQRSAIYRSRNLTGRACARRNQAWAVVENGIAIQVLLQRDVIRGPRGGD